MDNGEATDDGLQDTYNRALFQLVMTGFEPGDVPAMVQRAYLGDETMPDWETTDVTGQPVRLCPVHQIATRHENGTCYLCPQQLDNGHEQDAGAHTWELTAYGRGNGFHYARRRSTDGVERHPDGQPCACPNAAEYAPPVQQQQAPGGLIQPSVTPPQAAILIPVRHTAIPAWRMALIEALAAMITRLS